MTINIIKYGEVAQLLEHRTHKPGVMLNPPLATTTIGFYDITIKMCRNIKQDF